VITIGTHVQVVDRFVEVVHIAAPLEGIPALCGAKSYVSKGLVLGCRGTVLHRLPLSLREGRSFAIHLTQE
jgi:hypothetical protein